MRSILVAVVCVITLLWPAGTDPANLKVRWRLVYSRGDVVEVQTESTAGHPVTTRPPGSADDRPLWSPGGRFVLFRRSDPQSGLYALDTVTGQTRRLANAYPSEFAWHRDGARIAYAVDCGDTCEAFYVIERSGGQPRFVARYARPKKERYMVLPGLSWAPRGDAFAFVSSVSPNVECPCPSRLHVVDVQHGTIRTIAMSKDYLSGPAWSPDGSLIAYGRRCVEEGPADDIYCHLAVISPRGANARELDLRTGRTPWAVSDVPFVWRPRTQEIVFRADGGNDVLIGIAHARTGKVRAFRGRAAVDFAISADGRRLGYLHQAPNGRLQLHVADIRTGRVLSRRTLSADLGGSYDPNIDLQLP